MSRCERQNLVVVARYVYRPDRTAIDLEEPHPVGRCRSQSFSTADRFCRRLGSIAVDLPVRQHHIVVDHRHSPSVVEHSHRFPGPRDLLSPVVERHGCHLR